MQTSFRVPSEDDFDGVDVKYINPVTWAEETVQCRTPENPFPRKTEAYTIDVAMTADRAWRIGMRRLMKYLHQRRTYTATTSMLGLELRESSLLDTVSGWSTIIANAHAATGR